MKLKSISFKNFASYGNRMQKIEFTDDTGMFYLVVGENGSGKSSISDVMKFGSYGKLGTKRLRDIPNRFNNSAYTKIELTSKGKDISIERGISPNFLNLTVDNQPYDRAGKKNAEEYIEDDLIGMPFYVFNNIISLSINDFKSFLSMSPYDKRQIIDKIFGLEIINTIRWMVKNEIKSVRDEVLSLSKEVEAIDSTIHNATIELNNLKKQIKTDSEDTRKKILIKIEKYNSTLEELKIKLEEVQQKHFNANKQLKDFNEVRQNARQELLKIEEKKKLYENQKCPMCESDLHTDFHQNILKEYVDKELSTKETIEDTDDVIARLEKIKKKTNDIIIHYEAKKAEFTTIISNYHEQLKTLAETKNDSLQTQSIENIIEESKKRKGIVIKKKDTSDNKSNFFKLLEDIYGDKGVKQLAISKILPTLNAEIRQVLAELRMDYKVYFNQNFEAEISQLGYEVAEPQLSTGERKKVDFAVLISLIRLLKIKFPTTNIIFLDEVFSSIDADGIHHILKILSQMCKELNLNIFVVNHAPLPEEMFDYKIDVKKVNNFSSLDIHKIS